MQRFFLRLSLIAVLFLTGCVYSRNLNTGSSGTTGTTTSGTGVGHLYVSSQGSNEILIFATATGDNGSVTPTGTLTENLQNPQYIFSDAVNDRIYVANQGGGNILVFDGVSTTTGNSTAAPTRVITSTSLASPVDVQLDTTQDILYVADSTNDSIVVFAGASGANGTVQATHIIGLGFSPTAIHVDSADNILYVANGAGSAVDVLTTASTVNGTLNGTQMILSGSSTSLSQPNGLAVDPAGRLVVGNGNASIDFFASATTLNLNTAPVTILTSGSVSSPAQMTIDPMTNSGELYVADTALQQITVFTSITTIGAGTLSGAQASRTITGLTSPRGVAIDKTH